MRRVVAIPIAVISLLTLAGCERWALDRQMEELCKKDGGIKVYETVTLPASDFSNIGQPLARYQQIAKSVEDLLGPDYKYIRKSEILVGKGANPLRGEGVLTRTYFAIYRRADNRLLAESVQYDRGGGDGFFTFGAQPSGNSCPKQNVEPSGSVFLRRK